LVLATFWAPSSEGMLVWDMTPTMASQRLLPTLSD